MKLFGKNKENNQGASAAVSERKKIELPHGNKMHLRKGSYAVAAGAVALAIVVIANLLVAKIPSQYRNVDVSDADLTGITDTTRNLVKNLNEDVTVYLLAQTGQEDATIQKLLERYKDLSSHITVKTVDPVQHPGFAKDYTTQDLADNSLIVVGPERNKVIPYSDIYQQTANYQTYSYDTTGFDGEGQLTSAISYVTTKDTPVVYTLTGHQEKSITDAMTTALQKDNITTTELNLLTSGSVPDDADALIIYSPQKDISSDEADELISYMKKGGKLFLVTDYTTESMTNLQKVLNEYGIGTMDGIVLDTDASHYANRNPLYLVPEIGHASALGDLADGGSYILDPVAQGIETLDSKRDTVTVESMLTTSSSSYIKTNVNDTMEKADGDPTGPFDVGVAVSETLQSTDSSTAASADSSTAASADSSTAASVDSSTAASADSSTATSGSDAAAADTDKAATTKLVYLTTSNLFNDKIDAMVSGNNMRLLTNSMSWLVGSEEVSVSIPARNLQTTYLTVNEAAARTWGFVTIGLLPLAFLIFGGVLVYRRSKA
jgi:ABC-2 type transport system permease protein